MSSSPLASTVFLRNHPLALTDLTNIREGVWQLSPPLVNNLVGILNIPSRGNLPFIHTFLTQFTFTQYTGCAICCRLFLDNLVLDEKLNCVDVGLARFWSKSDIEGENGGDLNFTLISMYV